MKRFVAKVPLHFNIWLLGFVFSLAGCRVAGSAPSLLPATSSAASPAVSSPTLAPSATRTAVTFTATPTRVALTATPTLMPTAVPPTPTAGPYAGLTVNDLAAREYGGGMLETLEVLAVNSYFTRTLIVYPSDGLRIYGFMDTPRRGEPPHPVVVAVHGYIDPAIYETIDYTTRYADALARAGYLVLHPNLRGYRPSDSGDNRFRVGMAVDVLNLIALVREQGGKPGSLDLADPDAIGVWGHSMGGGIALRAITVDPDIRAAVLYGSMSGDEQKNYERIFHFFSAGEAGAEELAAPPEIMAQISPINYLERIQAAVSIHHGKVDSQVPLAWSLDLCYRLRQLGKEVSCFTYSDQPHTFYGASDASFMQRMILFYDQWLRKP